MDLATTVHDRMVRLLFRVLFVLAGALLTTLATWLVSSASASADTLPGIALPASPTDLATSARVPLAPDDSSLRGLLRNAVYSAGGATRTVGDTMTGRVVQQMTVSTPAALSRLAMPAAPGLATDPLSVVVGAVSRREVTGRLSRFLEATPSTKIDEPASAGRREPLPQQGFNHAPTFGASVLKQRTGALHRQVELSWPSGIGTRSQIRPVLPLTPDAPGCPPCQSVTAGFASAGNAGSSRPGDGLSTAVFRRSGLSYVTSLGVLPTDAHVLVVSGRQPGVTPD